MIGNAGKRDLSRKNAAPPAIGVKSCVACDREDPRKNGLVGTIRVPRTVKAQPKILQDVFGAVSGEVWSG
jgi:hypothetical protein